MRNGSGYRMRLAFLWTCMAATAGCGNPLGNESFRLANGGGVPALVPAVASGMTVTTQNANLRLYVYGEGGPEWSGAPHYDTSQVSAADADETTRSCTSLQLVHTDRFMFKPNDAGCWYVYGESTHYILSPAPAQQQTRQILSRSPAAVP